MLSRAHCYYWKILTLISCFALPSLYASTESLFQEGNQSAAQGRYLEAQAFYQEALQAEAAEGLYGNLGHAYAHTGKIGPASVAYERALLLNPNNTSIREKLHSLRQDAALKAPELALWGALLSPNAWTYGASFSFWLLLLLALAPKRPSTGLLRIGSALGFCVALTGLLAYQPLLHEAIVQTPDTPLRVSPAPNAQAHSTLPEGSCVFIKKTHNSAVFVQTLQGQQGWVEVNAITRIIGEV